MTSDTPARCGATYTTLGGRIFRCNEKTHTASAGHYFQRALDLEEARRHVPIARMTTTPGQRRG